MLDQPGKLELFAVVVDQGASVQVSHADIAACVTPFNPVLRTPAMERRTNPPWPQPGGGGPFRRIED